MRLIKTFILAIILNYFSLSISNSEIIKQINIEGNNRISEEIILMFSGIELGQDIKNSDINKLKVILANETTTMLHGKLASQKAQQTAKNTFENKSIGIDLPSIKLKKEEISNGINIIDLVVKSNLLKSDESQELFGEPQSFVFFN